MSFKTTGKVLQILPEIKGINARGEWKKQEFIIEVEDGQFPKKICFSVMNDKNGIFEKLKLDKDVEVSFSIESREFNGKWYSNNNAFRVDLVQSNSGAGNTPPPFSASDIPPMGDPDDKDDLPF